ncbi:MAG: class I SAM-dependent methyltransferase [Rhodospirillales bacterium]|nr:class I SAM-dependent methyltransferase [Rhodospirillales bacterium]
MRVGDSVRLDRPPRVIGDAHALIINLVAGSRVLNVGAAGNARYYKEHGTGSWLHKRLADRAAGLIGLDIDEAEIAAARNIGFDIIAGDCETVTLGETFDLIVLSDVIEHVGNPGMALANMAHHLAPGGRIVITTPQCHIRRNISKSAMRPFAECLLGSCRPLHARAYPGGLRPTRIQAPGHRLLHPLRPPNAGHAGRKRHRCRSRSPLAPLSRVFSVRHQHPARRLLRRRIPAPLMFTEKKFRQE